MKILYITHVDLMDKARGSSMRPVKMLNAFKSLGWELDTVVGFSNLSNIRQRTATVNSFIKKIEENCDYDFCYIEPPSGPMFTPADLRLMKLVHKKGIPSAIFYRDAFWKLADWLSNYTNPIKYRMIRAIQNHQWNLFQKYCDIIYCPTQTFCKEMNPKPTTRIAPLPPACDVVERYSGELPDKKKIIYVGCALEEAGVGILIEAMETVNKKMHVTLELVCRKDEYDTLNIPPDKYDWLHVSHISGKALESVYPECDFAVIPRKYNRYMGITVPIKLYEYTAYGLPIVASDMLETTIFINKYDMGIICDCTAPSLADAILKMYSDEEQFKKYHDNALKALHDGNYWTDRAKQVARDLGKLKD